MASTVLRPLLQFVDPAECLTLAGGAARAEARDDEASGGYLPHPATRVIISSIMPTSIQAAIYGLQKRLARLDDALN